MIPKRSVKNFLQAERDDFRKWKRVSPSMLVKVKKNLPHKPPIWKKLHHHQKVCFLIGARNPKFAFFLDTGCGKTLLSLSLLKYFKKEDPDTSFLVLVPNRINMYEWEREIQKHTPSLNYGVMSGSTDEKWGMLEEGRDILVTTYMGFVHMVCTLQEKKQGKGNEFTPDDRKLAVVTKYVNGIVLDESTLAGNHQSLTFRVLKKLSPKLKHVYLLTGTPFGRDPTPLWSQMYLVDQGQSLGPTLGLFRSAFFKPKHNPFSGFPDYVFQKKYTKELHRLLAHRSIRYEADHATLPRVVHIVKVVNLPKSADDHYARAKAAFVNNKGKITEMQNYFLRMRQISSGFIGFKDEDERIEFEFDENPKLDMLMSLVEEIYTSHKIVVFCEFVHSGRIICKALKEAKIGHVWIYGGTKNQEDVLKKFSTDEDCRVMVLNNSCGGYGLNLQIAKYGIYFESPVSPIIRKQTRRRIERQGTKHDRVFIYDLVTNGTVDESIIHMLNQGKDLFEEIINGRRNP